MLGRREKEELIGIALASAREAAALVLKGWRTHPSAEHKGRTDLVTEYDQASEALLRTLLSSRSPYPVVGEERGGSEGASEYAWFVDPIDGTTNFVHGHPFFCVSVGLARHGTPVLGAIVAPALSAEWTGGVDLGATRNGVPCRVSAVAELADSLLATGFPYDRNQPENNFDAFVAIKRRCQAVRRCGAAALDLVLVADGTYDGYWERRLKPWDIAAGAAIVLGAGGHVSDFDDGAFVVHCHRLLATNGAIHEALVHALAALGDPPVSGPTAAGSGI